MSGPTAVRICYALHSVNDSCMLLLCAMSARVASGGFGGCMRSRLLWSEAFFSVQTTESVSHHSWREGDTCRPSHHLCGHPGLHTADTNTPNSKVLAWRVKESSAWERMVFWSRGISFSENENKHAWSVCVCASVQEKWLPPLYTFLNKKEIKQPINSTYQATKPVCQKLLIFSAAAPLQPWKKVCFLSHRFFFSVCT